MSREPDPSKLGKQCRLLYDLAVEAGWDAQGMKSGRSEGVLLVAPPPNQRITITLVKAINDRMFKSWGNKIIRYGDPLKVAELHAKADELEGTAITKGSVLDHMVHGADWLQNMVNPPLTREEVRATAVPTTLDKVSEEEIGSVAPTSKAEVDELIADGLPGFAVKAVAHSAARNAEAQKPTQEQPLPNPNPPKAEPQIAPQPPVEPVSIEPWLARKQLDPTTGQGLYYRSGAVNERRWPGGRVDYVCSFPGCGYDSPDAIAVATHYGRRTDHPRLEKSIPRSEMIVGPTWEPKKIGPRRPNSLIHEIEWALAKIGKAWRSMDPDELAAAVGEHISDQRREDRENEPPREPLTAEEKLDRIRLLVDDGAYLAKAEELQEAKLRIAELEQQNMELSDRYAKLDGEWSALRDLIGRSA